MRAVRFAAILALAAASFPAAAQAAPVAARGLIDGSQPKSVTAIAKGFGEASLGVDAAGDPLIRARIGGRRYLVLFYGCLQGADCKTLTFTASWTSDRFTDTSMGEWNRIRRIGTAYLDGDGNPTLEMTVNLQGGVSRASLMSSFEWWRLLLGDFSGFLGV